MPNGYKCDRCSDFVEQGPMGGVFTPESDGPVHHVQVIPGEDDGDDFEMFDFTLCPRCRQELVNFVEGYEA